MVVRRNSLLPPYLIHHGIQQGSDTRNISHIHVIRTIEMRLISTIVPTGALSETVQVLEQIFAGQQTFRAILHVELLRCNTINTTARFPVGTETSEAELRAALGSLKVIPRHLPPEAINVDALASFVTQHGYITPAISGAHLWAEWLHHPCLLGVPIVGRNQYGYITRAFSGSPSWGEFNMATSPLPSRVPLVGRDQYGYITRAFSGSPYSIPR